MSEPKVREWVLCFDSEGSVLHVHDTPPTPSDYLTVRVVAVKPGAKPEREHKLVDDIWATCQDPDRPCASTITGRPHRYVIEVEVDATPEKARE